MLYQKAYGMRSLVPQAEPMTLDTVFDMASVTKVVETTTSVMMLVEDGRIRAQRELELAAGRRANEGPH